MELRQAVEAYDYDELTIMPRVEIDVDQVEGLVNELSAYHNIYRDFLGSTEQKMYSYQYILGLLDPDIKRKATENIALGTLGKESVRQMEYFIGESRWQDGAMLREHRRQIGLILGTTEGALILDGSDCAKQGKYSVGVQRQWCGELGKIANCQAGVYLGYSSAKGYSLLDRRLYMPECWFTPEYAEERYKCHVPAEVTFKTKNELAWEMIFATAQAGTLLARWLTMDEAFGRDTHLLDRIGNETEYNYVAEIPADTRIWTTRPETFIPEYSGHGRPPTRLRLAPDSPASLTVRALAAQLPADAWSLHALKQGSKGMLIATMASCRVISSRNGLPGPALWLIFRRTPDSPSEIHYFFSNAPLDVDQHLLFEICACRWPIETMFQQAKQFIGFNEYQTRTWFGWHHHMTLVILAFGFLARCHLTLLPDSPALTLPQVIELLKAVLPKPTFDARHALDLLLYKQQRNASAKKSHYFLQKTRRIDPLLVPQ